MWLSGSFKTLLWQITCLYFTSVDVNFIKFYGSCRKRDTVWNLNTSTLGNIQNKICQSQGKWSGLELQNMAGLTVMPPPQPDKLPLAVLKDGGWYHCQICICYVTQLKEEIQNTFLLLFSWLSVKAVQRYWESWEEKPVGILSIAFI